MNHILIIKDDGTFEIREFDETDVDIRLKQLQKAVDGWIERFNPIHRAYNEMRDVLGGEDFDLYANEEGLYRYDFNKNLWMRDLYPYSPIMGNVVVVGIKETDECIESAGIAKDKLERLVEWFKKK